jgi:hypothetical protein
MTLQPSDQIPVGCFFDHLGQRFNDLLFSVVDVLKTMKQQVLHGFDVLREKSHSKAPFYNDGNGTPRSVRGSFGTSSFGDANGGQTRTLREPAGPGCYGRLGRHAARHPGSPVRDGYERQ